VQTPTQTCKKCDRLLDAGAHNCSCGAPTALASFKERAEYEVKQWRAYKSHAEQPGF
jgi:hypothetical protein